MSASAARCFVGACLTEWGLDRVVEVVRLLTSELVTNAVVHARPHGPETAIAVVLWSAAGVVRVEVTDDHPGSPIVGDGPTGKESGRGLLLIDGLASAWGTGPIGTGPIGTGPIGTGKAVWFEVTSGLPA
ncbi:MAG: ATP-binding protein [Acidimicrobiales bacterium]